MCAVNRTAEPTTSPSLERGGPAIDPIWLSIWFMRRPGSCVNRPNENKQKCVRNTAGASRRRCLAQRRRRRRNLQKWMLNASCGRWNWLAFCVESCVGSLGLDKDNARPENSIGKGVASVTPAPTETYLDHRIAFMAHFEEGNSRRVRRLRNTDVWVRGYETQK